MRSMMREMAMSADRGAQVPAISDSWLGAGAGFVVVGRFDAPREEQRIVTFIDLIGSTGIAERLGSVRFHAFLSDVFTRLSEVVAGVRRRGPSHMLATR